MSFIVGVLIILLVINCLLLIFLVLVQLPKKDAGAGIAFGSGAADALFGSGSGNALTKITKWATVTFIGLALVAGHLQDKYHNNKNDTAAFAKGVQQKQRQSSMPAPVQQPPPAAPQPATKLLSTTPESIPAPATNAAK
jgi:protein translocase SecG subunit